MFNSNISRFSVLFLVFQLICSRTLENNYQAPPQNNPVETGYIPIVGVGSDICSKELLSHTALNIKLTIYVKDINTQKLSLWNEQGVVNPATYSKTDLQTYRLTPNCLFSQLPGNNKEFLVTAEIIGDCCSTCEPCYKQNGSVYFGRIPYYGESSMSIWVQSTKSNFVSSEVVVRPSMRCIYKEDDCPL